MTGGRRLGKWLAVAVVPVLVVLGAAGPASAHAYLESSQPGTSAVLTSPPRQVVLHFDEPVEIDFGSIRVLGPSGGRVDEGGTHHLPGDDSSVAIALPAGLAKGTYVVAWRVISADSHPVHGAFVFSVGTANGVPKAASLANALAKESGSPAVGVVFGIVRFVAFVALVLVVGVAAVVLVVWPMGAATRRVRALLWWSWGALVVATVLGIAVQGVYAADLPLGDIARPSLFDEVLHTRFGEVELLRLVLCAAFVPALVVLTRRARRRGEPGQFVAASARPPVPWMVFGAVVALGLLATPGLAGHASSTGSVPVGVALDVGHLVGVAVWLGGLAVLAGLLIPGGVAADRPDEVGRVARRFSNYAFGAVVLIVATGVVQSIRQVGSFYALFHTTYGRTLVVKVAVAIAMVGAASFSRRYVGKMADVPPPSRGGDAPRLGPVIAGHRARETAGGGVLTRAAPVVTACEQDEAGEQWARRMVRRLRRSVLAEAALAVGVLAATSLLVNAAPAKVAAAQPFTQSFDVLGVQVNAVIGPARAGPGNQFHFYVLGRLGQPVGIPELDAAVTLPAESIGPIVVPLRVGGPGHYLATGFTFPFAGTWDLKLTVRTSPIDEQEVFARFPVH